METVFVGNLSYFCTNAALVNFFSQLGPVQNVNVRRSKKNVPLHYGFAEMSQDMAQLACEKLNGLDFMGRKIRYAQYIEYNHFICIVFAYLTINL